jgi:hypothetical protein
LLNNREFYLDCKFNQKFQDEIKKMNFRFDYNKKVWIAKLENYKEIVEKLKSIKLDRYDIKYGKPIPDKVLTLLEGTLKYDECKVSLTPTLKQEFVDRLFPYQREGVKFGIKRDGMYFCF